MIIRILENGAKSAIFVLENGAKNVIFALENGAKCENLYWKMG